MAEYIEREALLNRLETHIRRITPIEESRDMFFHDSGVNGGIAGVVLEVQRAPAADVAPVVHGRWIDNCCYNTCSACGDFIHARNDDGDLQEFSYCPNCGARMDGAEC